jgi:hypothetical protein
MADKLETKCSSRCVPVNWATSGAVAVLPIYHVRDAGIPSRACKSARQRSHINIKIGKIYVKVATSDI